MTGQVVSIWRHPIKGHGREQIAETTLEPGKAMPFDRIWGVVHDASDIDGAVWASCSQFTRAAKAPLLAAIESQLDEATGKVTLTHPDRDPLVFDPDTQADLLVAWTNGMVPETRAQSTRIVRAQTQAFTDSDFPSVTLCNMSSHRAVEQRVGQPLSIDRWRGNIWFDGLAPWEEFDWMDREIQVGEAVLIPRERTDRCLSTHNNPKTGRRDVDVLGALDSWDHRDFSVRAEVVQGGLVRTGAKVKRL